MFGAYIGWCKEDRLSSEADLLSNNGTVLICFIAWANYITSQSLDFLICNTWVMLSVFWNIRGNIFIDARSNYCTLFQFLDLRQLSHSEPSDWKGGQYPGSCQHNAPEHGHDFPRPSPRTTIITYIGALWKEEHTVTSGPLDLACNLHTWGLQHHRGTSVWVEMYVTPVRNEVLTQDRLTAGLPRQKGYPGEVWEEGQRGTLAIELRRKVITGFRINM